MNVYVCGNPLVSEDALPIQILPELRLAHPTIEFIEFDPSENLPSERELIIIDTIINASQVIVANDIDAFLHKKALSLHDFDLGMNLKLAKKMGWIHNVTIIGIPPRMNKEEAIPAISNILRRLEKIHA